LPGLHFISLRYSRESQTRNWECGKCRCEFIARPEETEADIECPNCHQKREAV
jgi:DNA-directed RNA polymerase subunit RPC12/RpoP